MDFPKRSPATDGVRLWKELRTQSAISVKWTDFSKDLSPQQLPLTTTVSLGTELLRKSDLSDFKVRLELRFFLLFCFACLYCTVGKNSCSHAAEQCWFPGKTGKYSPIMDLPNTADRESQTGFQRGSVDMHLPSKSQCALHRLTSQHSLEGGELLATVCRWGN